jgi:hypothetical protein
MQNTSNEDFRALLPSKNRGGWRRVSAASKNKSNMSADDDAPGGTTNNTYKLADDGDRNAGGGVKSSTNSGTIEVRFMIDANHHRDFNLCMRLREFIVEARVMDPTCSILPLGKMGGE